MDAMRDKVMSHQVGGDHYSRMTIQPLEFILANKLGFVEGSVIKYVSRWENKGGIQDLKKASDMLMKYIHTLEFGGGA